MMKNLLYLYALIRFAFTKNKLLFINLFISLLSVILEIIGISLILPLTELMQGKNLTETFINKIFRYIGLHLSIESLFALILLAFVGRLITQFIYQVLTSYISRNMLFQLSSEVFSLVISQMPVKVLQKKGAGYIITLSGDECSRSSNLINYLAQLVPSSIMMVLYFTTIFIYSKTIALSVIVFLLLSFLSLFKSFKISHKLGETQVLQSSSSTALLIDSLNSLRSVRSFTSEEYVSRSYAKQLSAYVKTLFLIDFVSLLARFGPALILFMLISTIGFSDNLKSFFYIDLSHLVAISALLMRFFPVVGQSLNLVLRIISDSRSGNDITKIISELGEVQFSVLKTKLLNKSITSINVNSVSFTHVEGRSLIDDFSACFIEGNSYAIVGASGSGKSTFLDILLGFYEPSGGNITFNGVPQTELDIKALRKKIILVSQDYSIFTDTIKNNICMGYVASLNEIRHACKIACVDEFILSLPNGYENEINYKGANLSGGQKQRLAIARGVLRNPDVLILDESISGLDPETKRGLISNLKLEFKNRILIFVTHDTAVIEAVDVVYDINKII